MNNKPSRSNNKNITNNGNNKGNNTGNEKVSKNPLPEITNAVKPEVPEVTKDLKK